MTQTGVLGVTQNNIDGKEVDLLVIKSNGRGCADCCFNSECTNPPRNRVMQCFSKDRPDRESVFYRKIN